MAFVKFPINVNPPIQSCEELVQRAKQDDADALYWLAECMWRGEHVNKNTMLASFYYQLAALLGSPMAYYRLGLMFRYGQTVRKNTDLACLLLQGAFALGVEQALSAYALVLVEDKKTEESIIQGQILLKYAKDNDDFDAEYYIEEYYPEADELEVNLQITEEMKEEWTVQALDGLLKEIERDVQYTSLLMRGMEVIGEQKAFYDRVSNILYVWRNTAKVENNLPTNEINVKNQSNNVGEITGTVIGMATNSGILYGMRKFNQRQGHGSAAERANHLADMLSGKRVELLGNDNKFAGPDRLVDGVYIQSKYCQTGQKCIDAAFDKDGYKYIVDGQAMVIEVPADQEIYDGAVKAMKKRIANGEVPGVTDPEEAKNYVRRGTVTYEQSVKIARAGTIESITYDAVNGAVVATSAFGISAMVSFAAAIWSGKDWKEALKMSVETGLKVAGTTFVSSVLSAQLVRVVNGTVAVDFIERGSKELFKSLSPKATDLYLKAHQQGLWNIYDEPMNKAAELFKNDLITGSVTIALMSIPSVIDLFRGRISKKQLFKNVATTTASVAGGSIGRDIGVLVGAAIFPSPKIGAVLGGLAGAALGSYFAQTATKYFLDCIIEDDAKEMLVIVEDVFGRLIQDYLITESEAKAIMKEVAALIDEDFLKDMYASYDREAFVEYEIEEFFIETVCSRKTILVPNIREMLNVTNDMLVDIADKYGKTA